MEADEGSGLGPSSAESAAVQESNAEYEDKSNVTVSFPPGDRTRVPLNCIRIGRDELLAPAEEESPEAGPSEEESPPEGRRSLGQSGDPEEQEVIVIEEPEPKVEAPYKTVRVPRSPTQK